MVTANSRATPPLRIGLLVDSVTAAYSVYDFTQWASSHQSVSVTHLILCAKPAPEPKPKLAGWLRRLIPSARWDGSRFDLSKFAFCIVQFFERQIIKRNRRYSEDLRTFDLTPLLKDAITIIPIISGSDAGLSHRFDAADIQKVKDLNLDLLVQGGSCNLSGEILRSSRLGIISIQVGDNRTNRGGPAGFWEVYFRQDTTGFAIYRLTDNPNAGDVLMRGRFATRHYYTLNRAFILRKSNYYLKLIIEQIAATGTLPELSPNLPYSNKLRRHPSAFEIGLYVARFFSASLAKRIKRVLNIHYRWNVAFVHRDWRNTEFWSGIKLKNKPLQTLADPFVICRNGKDYCFVEDLDHVKQRGSIAVYELSKLEGSRVGTALEEDFHLSFPYLFEFQGELYMCPESSENRDIRIYKCIEFPLRWKLERVIMKNLSAVDSMFFEKDGKWWMLTNIDPAGLGDFCSELFIFSASSPLDVEWKPHPLNPVVVDASRARNAGCVIEGDKYFRFSQGQGFDFYGKRIVINEIVELTDTTYSESCLSVVTPSFGHGAVGTHHLHSNGAITVFDFAVVATAWTA
jgi:hypothetical protein